MQEIILYNNKEIQAKELSLLKQYEQSMRDDNMNPITIQKYLETVEVYVAHLENLGIKMNETKNGHVTDFINLKKNISPVTWNNRLTHIKQFYKWLQSNRIALDITTAIKPKKIKRTFAKKSLPPTVIREMIEYFKSRIEVAKSSKDKRIRIDIALRDYAFFSLICSLGSRAGLTTKIKIKDIGTGFHSNGSKVAVIRLKDKARDAMTAKPIPPFVFDAIEAYITYTGNTDPENYLFKAHGWRDNTDKPVSYFNMRARIENVFIKLGIKAKTTDKNMITPHSLRHSLAEMLVKEYGTEYVQHLYDHASIDTTNKYQGRNKDQDLLDNRPDIEGLLGLH